MQRRDERSSYSGVYQRRANGAGLARRPLSVLRLLQAVDADPTASSSPEMIEDASGEVAEKVKRLQRIVRLQPTESALGPTKPLLDLERSTEAT